MTTGITRYCRVAMRFDAGWIGDSIQRRHQNERAKQPTAKLLRFGSSLPHRHYGSAASTLDLLRHMRRYGNTRTKQAQTGAWSCNLLLQKPRYTASGTDPRLAEPSTSLSFDLSDTSVEPTLTSKRHSRTWPERYACKVQPTTINNTDHGALDVSQLRARR